MVPFRKAPKLLPLQITALFVKTNCRVLFPCVGSDISCSRAESMTIEYILVVIADEDVGKRLDQSMYVTLKSPHIQRVL